MWIKSDTSKQIQQIFSSVGCEIEFCVSNSIFRDFHPPLENSFISENVIVAKALQENPPKVFYLFLPTNQTNHVDYAKSSFKASVEEKKWKNTILHNELDLIAKNAIKTSLLLS